MNKKLYLVSLVCFGFLGAFSKTFDAWASDSATHSDIDPLLESTAKKPTHQLTSATLLEPDAFGKSTIMRYIADCKAQGKSSSTIAKILRDLKNNADDFDDFEMEAKCFSSRIPQEFITGLWNDFHNPALTPSLKAMLEKKTETTGSRTRAEMDLSALSSDMFSQSANHSSTSGLGQVDAANAHNDDDEALSGSCAQHYSTAHKRKPYSHSPTPFVSTQ